MASLPGVAAVEAMVDAGSETLARPQPTARMAKRPRRDPSELTSLPFGRRHRAALRSLGRRRDPAADDGRDAGQQLQGGLPENGNSLSIAECNGSTQLLTTANREIAPQIREV